MAAVHVECHLGERLRVVGARCRDTRCDHVAVADRLDLLEAVPLGKVVEMAEQVVEEADHLGGRQPLCQRREVDDVGEQDGRRAEVVGNGLGAAP